MSISFRLKLIRQRRPTEFFLDDFEYLLLIKLLGETLNSSQGLTTIALCRDLSALFHKAPKQHVGG